MIFWSKARMDRYPTKTPNTIRIMAIVKLGAAIPMLPVLLVLDVNIIKKHHRDDGRQKEKNGKFAQDGCVFKGRHKQQFFIF